MDTYFAHFFLFFNQLPFMLGLLAAGLIFANRTLFYHAACIMFVSIIINVALKYTFQLPLSSAIHHPGFAFPSGHMQVATVLYGFLALHTRNHILHLLIIGLLAGIGFGLVHFEYHIWIDVLGAIFFGGLILGVYQLMLIQKLKYLNGIKALIATLAMIYIASRGHIPIHAWTAYLLLLSFMITAPKVICIHKRI
jgi:hypothetical protein